MPCGFFQTGSHVVFGQSIDFFRRAGYRPFPGRRKVVCVFPDDVFYLIGAEFDNGVIEIDCRVELVPSCVCEDGAVNGPGTAYPFLCNYVSCVIGRIPDEVRSANSARFEDWFDVR